jgi:hypothetical protein
MLDHDNLGERLPSLANSYREASPFPHIVLDDFLTGDLLAAVLAEFPQPITMTTQFENDREVKSAESAWRKMGPATRTVLAGLNCGPFLTFLEELTGVKGLIADPHLHGGGLHQIRRGGKLGVHADFNFLPEVGLYRRLNLLLYLNPGWQEEWGGHLQLWDADMQHCVKKVAPILGRCVIFSTMQTAFHGHPDALECPPDITRKSMALYYYSIDTWTDEPTRLNTVFPGRMRLARAITPPILWPAAAAVKRAWRRTTGDG